MTSDCRSIGPASQGRERGQGFLAGLGMIDDRRGIAILPAGGGCTSAYRWLADRMVDSDSRNIRQLGNPLPHVVPLRIEPLAL